jgi:hypothetical protein
MTKLRRRRRGAHYPDLPTDEWGAASERSLGLDPSAELGYE